MIAGQSGNGEEVFAHLFYAAPRVHKSGACKMRGTWADLLEGELVIH